MKWKLLFSFLCEKTKAQSTNSRSQSKSWQNQIQGPSLCTRIRAGASERSALNWWGPDKYSPERGNFSGWPLEDFLSELGRWTDVLLEFHTITDDKQVSRWHIWLGWVETRWGDICEVFSAKLYKAADTQQEDRLYYFKFSVPVKWTAVPVGKMSLP